MIDFDEVARLHSRGIDENRAGRPRRAATHLRSALRQLESGASAVDATTAAWLMSRCRVLLTLAKAQFELKGLDLGMALLLRAEADADAAGDRTVRCAVCNQRGLMLLRGGRLDEALTEFDAAETFFDTAPAQEQCNVLLNRGALYLDRVDLALARRDLSRCNDLATRAGLGFLAAMAVHNLGYLEFLAGNLPLALSLTESALESAASPGVALLDRARILAVAGLTREVEKTLLEARAVLDRDRMVHDRAEVDLELATMTLQTGDPQVARRYAVRAREVFRRRTNLRWQLRADLLLLQIDLQRGRSPRSVAVRAEQLRTQLLAEGQAAHARTAAYVRSEVLLELGDVAGADTVLQAAGPTTPEDPVTARLQHRFLQARVRLAKGQRSEASAQVRHGLAEMADYQAHFGSVDLRTASAVHGRRLAELGVRIALEVGRPEFLYGAIERGRANSARMTAVRPAVDEATAGLFTDLRKTVEDLRVSDPGSEPAQRLQRRRSELERRISERSWSLPGADSAPAPAELPEVQAALAAYDTQLVGYVAVDGLMHGLRLSGRACESVVLGPAAPMAAMVRKVRADLDLLAYHRIPTGVRTAAGRSLARSLRTLDELLLRPMRLDGRRVFVAPPPVLVGLPWGALPSRAGTPTGVTSSGTAWLRGLPSAPAQRATRSVVRALAGPDLRRAAAEVAGIGRTWGVRPSAGPTATRRAFVASYAEADVVHVAAHGQHQIQNPLFSSLRLADGLLFAYELDRAEGAAPHVVLSACDLGLATMRPGDEALGLTSALLQLGTRSVVSGVARVADEIAATTMVAYHRRLVAGDDTALALATAVEEVRSADSPPAPFVCFGSHWAPGTGDRPDRRTSVEDRRTPTVRSAPPAQGEPEVSAPRAAPDAPGVVFTAPMA